MKANTFKLILAGLTLAAAATAGAENTTHMGNATATEKASSAATGKMPGSKMMPKSDAEIAAIVEAANMAEIEAARLAQSTATNAQVKSFATMMADAHTKNDTQGDALESRLKIQSIETADSKTMKSQAQAKMTELKGKTGADFDKAYIESQVMMHTQVAGDLETKLIPAAKNAEFKSFLQETLTHVKGHLAEVQKIQASLTNPSQTTTTK